mgnify:CR=1 FL=1
MTPVPIPQENAAGSQAVADMPVGGARDRRRILRSQANAPCL